MEQMESRSRPPRVVIEAVRPQVDGGRFAIKRIAGDRVVVEADVFADGQDLISCVLKYRPEQEPEWAEGPTEHIGNDRWRGSFVAGDPGLHRYSLEAWIDHFGSWRRDLAKKLDAGMDVWVDVLVGAELAERAATAASGADAEELRGWATRLRDPSEPALAAALSEELALLMGRHPDRSFAATSREFPLVVDRERARFGAWYEIFPRSASADPSRPGTLADCEEHIPYLAAMGFDVLYLPPIHPTGATHRKGKNNNPSAGPDDPGSPWAIGSEAGGHKAIDPLLGDLGDFDRLVKAASEAGIEVALDLAYQCSPDHPYVSEHPEWFRRRPDGTTRYAENPPKKYEDIYPLDFDTEAWRELWEELRSVVEFWMDHGVRIFRVDNPHTKPFAFWEWLIDTTKADHPDVIFLAEAFTRPKVMYRIAKLGFTQSYTYFTWRNTKWELTEYLTELTRSEVREFFRPSFWPNTPDILHEYLQRGGRPAFMTRLVLATTLAASYGVFGPAFELCENRPREAGSEEYLNSEKYEVRHWDLDDPRSLSPLMARLNQIRRENPALQRDGGLRFHRVDNDELIVYSKESEDGSNVVLIVVNLDPHHTQSGWIEVSENDLRVEAGLPFQVHDLLRDESYLWQGSRHYVELNPGNLPAHIFGVGQHRVRDEHDFEYFV